MTLPKIQLFDTMSGAKRPLEPVRAGHVGMYVCGVTVYDLTHIGHARVYASFGSIAQYLRLRGYEVTYVRNFTDVDDKIINRAAERGEESSTLAQRFIDALEEDFGALGLERPDVSPRVSTHIAEIIEMIERLIANDHAYAVDGDVYYAIEAFREYGKLSGMRLDQLLEGARVDVDPRKRSPADFALWKAQKPGEPAWPSPWGLGRPGWHIECSAMARTHLGDTFDIHGGGKDLVFPHHENELAQSEGANGCEFARNWMHVGLVNVDGEKMSKSLGNFWTVRDVLGVYHPEVIRYFFMSAHYRKPIAYSSVNLDLARHRLTYLYSTLEAIRSLWTRVPRPAPSSALATRLQGRIFEAMDDDFNTPVTLAVLGEAAKLANELLTTKKLAKRDDVLAELAAVEDTFALVSKFSGFLASDPTTVLRAIRDRLAAQLGVDGDFVRERLAAREAARAAKDWAQADVIRDELAAIHVSLMDGVDGTDWRIDPPEPEVADDGAAG
ncbi:MAG: cysteine--tRNA ligase [Myxococcales bacterium]|nr:cysteine--tRNA ligase [Myxococcales bacterium]MCB9519941.1 cysteine--tRNA ligase [Myxococcales bacterium]MCB9533151.1 cysteine--tRNA ligase [Myxococcales bacterium]